MYDFNNARLQPATADDEFLGQEDAVRWLRDHAEHWVPELFPQGRIDPDAGVWRVADISGRAPRKQGSCVICLHGEHAGSWHDFDGGKGGGPISTVAERLGLSRAALFAEIRRMMGTRRAPPGAGSSKRPEKDHSAEINHTLSRAVPIAGTLAETYFHARGITEIPICADLSFNDNCTHWGRKTGEPALIARFRYPNGVETGGLHRIYLKRDGSGHDGKKMLGPVDGGVVMLSQIDAGGRLAVGEGIETTLAGMQIYGLPGWATASAGNMKKLGDFIAEYGRGPIQRLDIFADRGKAGEEAAQYLARAAQKAGIEVTIRLPIGDDDFADDLLNARGRSENTLPVNMEDLLPRQQRRQEKRHAAAAERAEGRRYIFPGDLLGTAKKFIQDQLQTSGGLRMAHHHRSEFFLYDGAGFYVVDLETMKAKLWPWLAASWQRSSDDKERPVLPDPALVSGVLEALRAASQLDNKLQPPLWVAGAPVYPAKELIVFRNTMLHVLTGHLLANTPDFFTPNALDFDYRPELGADPVEWLRFLHALWADDEQSIACLQEVFGLMMIPDTSHQKIFLLVGPARSGKGTVARVLQRLVGPRNVCAPTLSSLGGEFGLQPLLHKAVGIIGDARLGPKSDTAAIAERLLSISGEDAIDVHRKFLSAWHGQLNVRFLIISNETPRFSDTSGALASRFIILTLTKSFLGQEDLGLLERLLIELPGIANWALVGLKRLRERGYFRIPTASRDAMVELDTLASPMRAFLQEGYKHTGSSGDGVLVNTFCDDFKKWSLANGREFNGSNAVIGAMLRSAASRVTTSQLRTGARGDDGRLKHQRWFLGIRPRRPEDDNEPGNGQGAPEITG